MRRLCIYSVWFFNSYWSHWQDGCLYTTTCLQKTTFVATAGINIRLVNIPGHSGFQGNIEADKYAKEIAYKIHKGYMSAPINVSVKTAFSLSRDIAMRSWQRMWDNETSGRYTHNLIPSVDSKVLFPLSQNVGISYCRLLLHDSMLQDDSFRTGTSDSSVCECGSGKETTDHNRIFFLKKTQPTNDEISGIPGILLHCSTYRKQREEMVDQLLPLCDKDDQVLDISETLLLAPQPDNISRGCSRIIKELLFEFISSTSRKL